MTLRCSVYDRSERICRRRGAQLLPQAAVHGGVAILRSGDAGLSPEVHPCAMNDSLAIRHAWDMLLAEHRELVSAYLEVLGTDCAPFVARQVHAVTAQIAFLGARLGLGVDVEDS